ncbi:hypothetical protein H0H93_003862 [Arthromyces matolae]|nr:hypothetical protein H0H93_003862 [Arthromyces matolae]
MSPRLTSESPASPTFLCRSPKLHGDTLTCRISSTQRTQIERHLSLSDLEISLPLVFHMVAPRSHLPPAPLGHVLSSPNAPSASICSIWETISGPRPFCTVLDNARFPSKASRSGPMCAVRNTIPLEPVLECPAIEPLLWMPFNRQSISRPASISQPPPFCAILEAPKPAPTCPVQNTIPLEPVLECPAIEPLLWMPSERQSASRPVSISPPRPICSIFEAPKPAPTCAVQNISPLERVLECSAIEPLLWTPSKRKSHSRPVCPVPSRLPPQGNATGYFNFNLPFGLVLLIMILLKGMLSVWFSWLQPTQQPVHKLLEIDAPQCDRESLIDAVVTLLLATPPEDCDMIMAHINSEDEDSAIDTSSAAVIEDNVNDNGNARQELDLASVLLPYALSPSDARNFGPVHSNEDAEILCRSTPLSINGRVHETPDACPYYAIGESGISLTPVADS